MMSTIKTIIVDDEARIRRGIERIVLSCGEEWEIVGTFSNGLVAYEAIINHHVEVDLLITDVQMPEMDGLTLIKKLKRDFSFFSIIISGYDDFQYLQTAIREGAINYLLKPVDREQFRLQMQETKEKINLKRIQQESLIELQQRASHGAKTKQLHLLSEVTWNVDSDLSMFEWTKQFPMGKYVLMNIAVDMTFSKTSEQMEKDLKNWNMTIENVFEELLSNYNNMKSWYWRKGKLNFWMLLFDEGEASDSIFISETHQFALQLKNTVQRSSPFTISIAIGTEFDDLLLLPNFRDQLTSLLQFRLIKGGNHIFIIDENSFLDEKPKGISTSINKSIEKIVHSMDIRSENEVKNALKLFFLQIEELPSPILIQETVCNLLINIIKIWMDQNATGEDLILEAVYMTKNASNFSQLKDSVKHWVLDILGKVQDLTVQRPDSLLLAKEWIINNLNENITIKKLASIVYMYPTYFCEYFKNQTGETVLDYVTKCRMDKAKELLKMNEMKIYEVSIKVGYQDTKYFSRLFKQWTRSSPSEYRENQYKTI